MHETKKWFACELHCHTVHSDGDFTVETLLATARERKLDGICLTDHNTQSGVPEAQAIGTLPVLGGMEWTTYFGHMPVLDCKHDVDWRDALPDTIDEKLRQVHENGGICGVAHPFQIGTPICTGGHWDYNVQDWALVNYMEIWSEGSPYLNTANRRAIGLWESILDKGFHLTPTLGRDWHRPTNNIYPAACTYLLCDGKDLTPEKMKTAIRDGHTVVSAGPLFYFVTEAGATVGDTVQAGETVFCIHMDTMRADTVPQANTYTPQTVRILTNGGEILAEQAFHGGEMQIQLTLHPAHWYRAELWGEIDGKPDCQLAVTAPIYTE